METVKISLKTPVQGFRGLTVLEIIENEETLTIRIPNTQNNRVIPGQTLMFKRNIYSGPDEYFTIKEGVTVLSVSTGTSYLERSVDLDTGHVFLIRHESTQTLETTKLSTRQYTISDDASFLDAHGHEGRLNYVDGLYGIITNEPHTIFEQDIVANVGQELYIKDYQGNVLATCADMHASKGFVPLIMDDCLSVYDTTKTCGKDFKEITTYAYTFLPMAASRDVILIGDIPEGNVDILNSEMSYIETKFNPFYYYKEINGVKKCHLWNDVWWDDIMTRHSEQIDYITYGHAKITFGINEAYWTAQTALGVVHDDAMGSAEDAFNERYVETLKEEAVPEVIDFERLKYIPSIYNEDETSTIVDSLIFNLHFRKRQEVEGQKLDANGEVRKYHDLWAIDENTATRTWWNGCDISGVDTFNSSIAHFIEENADKSDLLGYLNFTENDVYYRKKKVGQSFLRLSFYTSKDPITQKLLYYSTVFMDGNVLYGKHIRLKSFIAEHERRETTTVFYDNAAAPTRVDSQFVITNEYDRTKSSEGFNLYLFADDAYAGNEHRTIYMKVEFNHAGNGKTIPLIQWPKDGDGNYTALTLDNFLESLYIPVEIYYNNNRYMYAMPTAENNEEGNSITLSLFEPKIDQT